MYKGAKDIHVAPSLLAEDEAGMRHDRSSALPPVSGPRSGPSERTREMLRVPTDRAADRASSIGGPLTAPTSGPTSTPLSGRWTGPDSHMRPTAVTRLHATPFSTIELDRENLLVRFTRSELPFTSIAEVDHEANEIERVLERFRRSRLLVDLRTAVPPRDAPAMDAAMERFRQRLLRGSDRAVILVRTAVGALQVKRHMREDGANIEVFQSEEEALAHLEGMQPESSSRASWSPPVPSRRFARR